MIWRYFKGLQLTICTQVYHHVTVLHEKTIINFLMTHTELPERICIQACTYIYP